MQSKQYTWQIAWDYQAFRVKFILGIFILVAILIFIPHFFSHIEGREGVVLNDMVLKYLPAKDVSLFIFIVLYGMICLLFYRISKNTIMCLTALWSFIFLCIIRMITIKLVPLNPPTDIIHLADPCSILFYHSNVITKDLFFSGHTATVLLAAFCMEKKRDKMIAFVASGVMAILLLIQHVHYTVDVLAAPLFMWLCWYLGKIMAKI